MSKQEGRSDRFVSAEALTHTPDDLPIISAIRPAPGHPLASLSVFDQERAREAEPSTQAATWANLHELAHAWGSFACALASITSPASAHVFQAIGMAFLALSHEESGYAHYFLLGNRLRYGMPRTFQMDAVVGHQDSAAHPSHFIALNLDGHLSVMEMQGRDVSKTVIYAGPILYGQDADLVAVTLSIAHDGQGKPELVLHYQNNEVILYDGKDGKFHQQPQQ